MAAILPKVSTVAKKVEVHEGEGGETVRMVTLPLSLIEMPEYQRERKTPFINKIKNEWDATAYAFPLVALYGGQFLDLDGQQRLAAKEERADEFATVLLIEGIRTRKRLADVFLKINRDRKLLVAFEKYVAAVCSEDRGTLEIQDVLAELGHTVGKSATANGRLPAGAVTRIHESGGAQLLRRTVEFKVLAWDGLGAREANEGTTLLGLAAFVKKYWDKLDDDRLVYVLRQRHPGYILSAINRHRGERISYADFLKEHYNKGLRGAKKL